MRTIFPSNGLLFGLLIWYLLMPALALAAGFQINLVNTSWGFHLNATTIPAGRLIWLQGDQPDTVTNIVQIEGISVVQHDFALASWAPAAFYRAVQIDTNYELETIASGESADATIMTNGVIEVWETITQARSATVPIHKLTPIAQQPRQWLVGLRESQRGL